jgi:hypothetical protein
MVLNLTCARAEDGEKIVLMISQNDIDSAQARIDKAQAALRAYAERGDQEPTDLEKHSALTEQLRSANSRF